MIYVIGWFGIGFAVWFILLVRVRFLINKEKRGGTLKPRQKEGIEVVKSRPFAAFLVPFLGGPAYALVVVLMKIHIIFVGIDDLADD